MRPAPVETASASPAHTSGRPRSSPRFTRHSLSIGEREGIARGILRQERRECLRQPTPNCQLPTPNAALDLGVGCWKLGVYLLPKFTLGACWASFGASKYGYSPNPKILAVMFEGKRRRVVLYSWIRSL